MICKTKFMETRRSRRSSESESELNNFQNNKKEEEETDGVGVGGKMRIRIHVGGLGGAVTEEDLRRMFGGGGTVEGVDIVRTKGRSFAYVDFLPSDDKSLSKLFTTYNGCAWKGGKLRLQKAKEDYLVRLQREWDEDAGLLAAAAAPPPPPPPPDDAYDIKHSQPHSLSHPTNTSTNNTKQLRIFFPAVRTVKALPFTGTGKHKYSFQRLQVPSLPVHFCDCEEHYVPVPVHPTTKPNQTQSDQLLRDNGIDEQELNIMNKVMDRLFKTQTETNVDDRTHQQPHQPNLDSTTPPDEDNLIINVVSGNHEKEEKLSEFQEFKSTGTQAPKEKRSSPSEAQINIDGPPKKKRKSLPSDYNNQNEFEAALSGSKKNLPTQSKVAGKFLGAQPDQPELGQQQVSWSQKSSWRQLVGQRGSSTFSVSHVLIGIASSTDQVEPKSGSSEVTLSDSKDQDLESNGNSEDQPSETELVEPQPTKSVVVSNKLSGRGASSTDQVEPTSGSSELSLSDSEDQDLESNGNSEDQPSDTELVEPQPTKSVVVSNKVSGRGASSTDQVEPTSGSSDVSLSDSEDQDLESNGNSEDQPSDMELVEPQPTKSTVISNKLLGRGASWRQQSSWTQLVNDNTDTSFSIKQIVPGISSEQQFLPNLKGADSVSSTDGKLKEMVKQDDDKFTRGESSCLGIGREDDVLLGSLEDTIVDNDSACDPDVEKICAITPKQASAANIEIGETCSFMRTASSLKEWAKIKAALSGSSKKNNGSSKKNNVEN